MVYWELLRRGGKVHAGKIAGLKVDFVVEKSNGTEYYQVASSVRYPSTMERELAPFRKIRDHHPKVLLTPDAAPSDNIDGIRKPNTLDWLLQG